MDTKEKVALIDRVLRALDGVPVTGLRNCGKLWSAACELERLRFTLEREADEDEVIPVEEEVADQ